MLEGKVSTVDPSRADGEERAKRIGAGRSICGSFVLMAVDSPCGGRRLIWFMGSIESRSGVLCRSLSACLLWGGVGQVC